MMTTAPEGAARLSTGWLSIGRRGEMLACRGARGRGAMGKRTRGDWEARMALKEDVVIDGGGDEHGDEAAVEVKMERLVLP